MLRRKENSSWGSHGRECRVVGCCHAAVGGWGVDEQAKWQSSWVASDTEVSSVSRNDTPPARSPRPTPDRRPGPGISTWFPFGVRSNETRSDSHGSRLRLRTDSTMSKYCSHGSLLHFSLQRSRLNTCYYHQDLHSGGFHRGSRPGFSTWGGGRARIREHTRRSPARRPTPSYSLLHHTEATAECRPRPLERHPFSGLVHSAGELLHTP